MSKYIIEIKSEYEDTIRGIMVLGAKDSNLYMDAIAVEDLKELNSDYINEHYGSLQDEAYQKGLTDAWEAARKIAQQWEEDTDTEHRLVIDDSISVTLDSMTASEAIEKLKAYEEKQKEDEDVKRGDVVRNKTNGLTYIVTLASDCGYVLLNSDGNFRTSCITNSFEKTGKHVDIDKILEELRK